MKRNKHIGVVHKGRLQRRVGSDADKCRQGGFIACGHLQLSIALRVAVLACSCTAFLITPTVTALAVLNRPLRLLDVCCLWLLGLWHGTHASVTGESATSHPSLAAHGPRTALLLTVCSCCNIAFHWNESCCCSVEYRLLECVQQCTIVLNKVFDIP